MRYRIRSRLLVLVVMVLISMLAIGAMSSQASDPDSVARDQGKSVGEARVSAPMSSVAKVGTIAITDADFEEGMKVVSSDLDYMQAQIAAGNPNSEFLQQFVELINAHDTASVALAALIEDRSVYLLAVQRGYQPSTTQVKVKTEQDRNLVNTQGTPPQLQAYINVVGEEYYWSTLYPQIAERTLASQALYASVTKDHPDAEAASAAWLQVKKEAVAEASVTIVSSSAIAPATRDSAMNYLNAYWDLRSS